jgi:hypothetical protein
MQRKIREMLSPLRFSNGHANISCICVCVYVYVGVDIPYILVGLGFERKASHLQSRLSTA